VVRPGAGRGQSHLQYRPVPGPAGAPGCRRLPRGGGRHGGRGRFSGTAYRGYRRRPRAVGGGIPPPLAGGDRPVLGRRAGTGGAGCHGARHGNAGGPGPAGPGGGAAVPAGARAAPLVPAGASSGGGCLRHRPAGAPRGRALCRPAGAGRGGAAAGAPRHRPGRGCRLPRRPPPRHRCRLLAGCLRRQHGGRGAGPRPCHDRPVGAPAQPAARRRAERRPARGGRHPWPALARPAGGPCSASLSWGGWAARRRGCPAR
jgi:hypothetical protein